MSDHPFPWKWQEIPAGIYGLADRDGRPVLRVTRDETIAFSSPLVRSLTELAPEMETLLREYREDDVLAKSCAVQPGAAHSGLTAEACGMCWFCRVDLLLAKIDEARKAGGG